MTLKTKLGIGAGVLLIGGSGAVFVLGGDAPVSLDVSTAQEVVWDKPTTDDQWAKDVKKESFDIKSTGVLTTMVTDHTEKLKEEQATFETYDRCVQRMYWERYADFKSRLAGQELEDTVQGVAKQDCDAALYGIEKLKQSIERMNNELRLRQDGFVSTDPHSNLPEDRKRKIHD